MIENLAAEQISRFAFRLTWTSTLGAGTTFYVYLDGQPVGETQVAEWLLSVAEGEAPVVEVLDDPAQAPEPGFPGYLLITWYAVAGAERYLVQENVAGTWTTRSTVIEDGRGYYLVATRFLEDSTVHSFRVLPRGTNENNGVAAALTCLMVRHPDPPDVRFAYSSSTGAVTITGA